MRLINMFIAMFVALCLEAWGIIFAIVKIIEATEVGFAEAISQGDVVKAIVLIVVAPSIAGFVGFLLSMGNK